MRQGSVPPNAQPGSHFRRESGHSAQGDNAGAGRGNFQQGGRGRGGYNPNFNPQMGYPPNNLRAGPGQGRGSMAPNFTPQPRSMPYPNSPQLNRSPALVPSMPNTPNMAPAAMQPNMSMQTPPQYHYPPPMGPQHQQVNTPFLHSQPEKLSFKPSKRIKGRRETEKSLQAGRLQDSTREHFGNDTSQRQRRLSKPLDQSRRDPDLNIARLPTPASKVVAEQAPLTTGASTRIASQSLDLSPEHGLFEYMLTLKNQNYGYPPQPQLDGYGRPVSMPYGYNNMNYMAPPQSNSPGYTPNYAPPPYHQATHSMSRTPSQPERPSSANPQNQPVIVSSTPQPQHAQPKPVSSNNFVMPRRSAAIQIKNLAGEVVDTSSFKAPASPSPSVSQSKTPPVATSTPTPPPKSSTPSQPAAEKKTAKQIQDELKEKIKQATQAPQLAEEKAKKEKEEAEKAAAEKAAAEKAAAAAAPEPVPTKAEETKPTGEPKKEEPAPKVEEKPAEPVKAEAEKPAEPAKAAEPVKAAEPAKSAAETEEEQLERMIREMEEEDARREAAAAEYKKKADMEKAAAKAKAEEDRKKNAADEDRKLREQEREMERLEEEKEKRRAQGGSKPLSVAEALAAARSGKEPKEADKVDSVTDKLAGMKIGGKSSPLADQKPTTAEKRGAKPAALNLAPLNTKSVEPAQPSAALQSLKSARFLKVIDQEIYPAGIKSPNPALNAAVAKKGKTFKYDANFLLQFQKVFTEQPSLEFHQQVKSLIGDNDRSASSRGQTPSTRQPSRGSGFGGMGNFGAPGRTLPPGTSSETRFAMANNPMARPQGNPIQSFRGPGGAFPGSANMSRTSSQSNMPNSPRQSSRSTRGGSRRNDYSTKDAQAAKNMPLTAGQEVKPIAITATGWKPSSVGKNAAAAAAPTGYLDPELVQRKVKAALNKMTPEKFDRIADQILEIASQSKDESDGRTLRQVIQLTFEKATDEAHWASMYAKFCKRMLETMSPEVRDERIKDKNGNVVNGGNLFRKYLLNRCQEEFERGWSTSLPEKPDEEGPKKTGEAVLMSDEYYVAAAAKRRGLGLVQFIGELYKLGMLTERIMHECVHKLVDYKGVPDETEIESLSKLLRTIGANLDATDKGKPLMDAYFQRIQTMVDLPELQSRMKFMLMDVIDLRRSNWHSKEANKGPKTLDEVRLEVCRNAKTDWMNEGSTDKFYRLRLLKPPRLKRMPVATTAEVVVPRLDVVMPATSLPAMPSRPATRSVWTTCAGSRVLPTELPVATSHWVLLRCSRLVATADDVSALVALSAAPARTLVPPRALEPLPLLPPI